MAAVLSNRVSHGAPSSRVERPGLAIGASGLVLGRCAEDHREVRHADGDMLSRQTESLIEQRSCRSDCHGGVGATQRIGECPHSGASVSAS